MYNQYHTCLTINYSLNTLTLVILEWGASRQPNIWGILQTIVLSIYIIAVYF